MELWKIIAIIVGIVIAFAIYKNGLEVFKANPLSQTIDSAKNIIGSITNRVKGESTPVETENLGKPSCTSDAMCDGSFPECDDSCECLEDGTCLIVKVD